jgi:hypothetical protein
MANTYTHRIVSLKKENGVYLNIIKSFVIEVTASNGSNQISSEYKIDLTDPKIDFTEYQNLTEENVIAWFTNHTNEYWLAKQDIDKKLQESMQDTVESNFPWS